MKRKFDSKERTKPIEQLVIHSFALAPEKMLNVLHQYGLSVHYLIDSKGKVYSLVSEDRLAWHAGTSFWAGKEGLNWTSIGIELEHLDYGQTGYPEIQIKSLEKLAKEIITRYKICPENIVGHSDIAPIAKMDPGRGFPWKKLAEQGIGLWYDLNDSKKMLDLNISELLSIIGYDISAGLKASSWAFRRRFMPETIPYDKDIVKREKEVFEARQKNIPIPSIYPSDLDLADPDFMKVLRAVAYQYQQARIK